MSRYHSYLRRDALLYLFRRARDPVAHLLNGIVGLLALLGGRRVLRVGEDSFLPDPEGAIAHAADDGVAHVGDEDGHCGDGDDGPDYEEGLAGVGLGVVVAIADCKEGGVGEE